MDREELKYFFSVIVLGQLKGGESRDGRCLGEEVKGEGLRLQMLLVWMLDLHRNALKKTAGVNKALLKDK